jgi:integrase
MQEIQARRAPKGSVRVIESHGRLQIYFRVGGKRYYLSTGFADTSINRIDVEAKAQLIENDILNERFDPTLAKYKPASALSTVTPDPPPTLTMRGLWAQYMEHRSGSVAPKTIGSTYRSVTVHLERCSADPLVDALQFRRELLEATTKLQARRTLMQLSACAKWALKHRMISTNPFAGMYNELDKDIPAPPCAFSLEERDSIIEAFENHQVKGGGISYAYYAPLVKFLLDGL